MYDKIASNNVDRSDSTSPGDAFDQFIYSEIKTQ